MFLKAVVDDSKIAPEAQTPSNLFAIWDVNFSTVDPICLDEDFGDNDGRRDRPVASAQPPEQPSRRVHLLCQEDLALASRRQTKISDYGFQVRNRSWNFYWHRFVVRCLIPNLVGLSYYGLVFWTKKKTSLLNKWTGGFANQYLSV